MTSTSIENYFQKDAVVGEEEVAQDSSQKRSRSEGSSASASPDAKKPAYGETEDDTLKLPNDAPFWVPTLFKSIDKINANMHVMSIKFDVFKADMDKKIDAIKTDTEVKVKNLEENMEEVYNKQNESISELTDGVKYVSDSFDSQKKINEELLAQIESLENHHETIKQRCHEYEEVIVEHENLIDSLEQYGRRNCLLIHGVPESPQEDTDNLFIENVNSKLDLNIKARDLDRTHRIGKPAENKIRPIIAKFARYNKRKTVYTNKRKLKGTNVTITESLTKARMIKLNAAKDKFGKENVWTTDGEILTKRGNKVVNINLLWKNQYHSKITQ